VLKIGIVEYPPHLTVINKEVKGPSLAYIKQMFSNHYSKVEFIYLPTKRAVIELNKGRIDLLFPLPKTKEVSNYLTPPLFHSVPGLCFKKENFIPLLSAIERFNELSVAIPAGTKIPSSLLESTATIKIIEGKDIINRGISLLLRNRFTALYHPSPIQIYHYNNPLSKEIACSYFHGYSEGVYVGVSPFIKIKNRKKIDKIYADFMHNQRYDYYFAQYNILSDE